MAAKRKQKRERDQSLSEADIIAAALRLIRRRGVDALGMRGLAKELGVSPMAIYYYVPNKEDMLSRVAESLLARLPRPTPSEETWIEQLREHVMALWDLFQEYPGLSQSVMERPPVKATRVHTAHTMALFRAGGFDERTAFLNLLTLHTYVAGVLAVQTRIHQLRARTGKKKVPAVKSMRDETAFYLEQLKSREWMSFSVDTVLAGFRAQPATRARKSVRVGRARSA